MTKTQIAIFKLRFCYLEARFWKETQMEMIRASGFFNFREMIVCI